MSDILLYYNARTHSIPSVNNRIVRTHRRRTVVRRLVFDKLKYFNRSVRMTMAVSYMHIYTRYTHNRDHTKSFKTSP